MTSVPCKLFTKHSHLFLLFTLTVTSTCWEDHCPQAQIPEAQSQAVTCPRSPSYKIAESGLVLGLLWGE